MLDVRFGFATLDHVEYSHTQAVYRVIVALVASSATALAVVVWLADDAVAVRWSTAVILVIAVAFLFVFSKLTVTVGAGSLDVVFGFGWPRRTMDLSEIVAVRQVRNAPYHGWGVRRIRGGWMYNVWGLDAVELDLTSGKKFRIGTDDPARLLVALDRSLPS